AIPSGPLPDPAARVVDTRSAHADVVEAPGPRAAEAATTGATVTAPARAQVPTELAQAIEASLAPEGFEEAIAPVAPLYLASFDRVPDYEGFIHYIGEGSRGTSIETIAEAFAGSR